MLSLTIYLVTGLATGWQVFQLIMWAVWGRPVHSIEEAAFAASLTLIFSSFFALRHPKGSAIAALTACAALWLFYIPAMRDTLSANPGRETLREMVSMNGTGIFAGPMDMIRAFAPGVLLVAATIYAALQVTKLSRSRTRIRH
jgi:hypothetical protein